MSKKSFVVRASLLSVVLFAGVATPARAQVATFTAVAAMKNATGASTNLPLTVVITKYATEGEKDELLAAVNKGGTASARALLSKRGDVGTVQIGTKQTPIKYAFMRAVGAGQLITAVTVEPIAMTDAAPGAQSAEARLGLVLLEANTGTGHGELAPSAKVRTNADGAIVTENAGVETVPLSNVVKK